MNRNKLPFRLRRRRSIILIVLFILPIGVLASQTPLTGRANTESQPVYLPLLMGGEGEGVADATTTPTAMITPTPQDTATATATATATQTATVTPTSTAAVLTGSLTGSVRVRPESTPPTLHPVRYLVVLDVSGSMNFDFDGQGKQNGEIRQCGNSADPEKDQNRETCQPNLDWAWEPLAERRTYVARQAISQMIEQINIPGNAQYQDRVPADQMRFVAFAERVKGTTDWSSDKATLLEAAKTVGEKGEYTTDGGTNGAAGLYQAGLLLAGDNTVTDDSGHVYTYKTVVIFVTDGVSNYFLMKELPNHGYGVIPNTDPIRFPNSPHCANMDQQYIAEAVECQINESAGGPYTHTNGITYDRPITAMVKTSQDDLHANGHEVYVVALSSFPNEGLVYGVASSPLHYYEAPSLEIDLNTGETNVDMIFQDIYTRSSSTTCSAIVGAWTDTIDAAHMPAGLPEGEVGAAYLYAENGSMYEAPIRIDAQTGKLTFTLDDIPAGDYTFRAYVHYTGDDQILRQYHTIYAGDTGETFSGIPVTITTNEQTDIDLISLVFDGDVCAGSDPE